MKKKELRKEIKARFKQGTSKTAIFEQLKDQSCIKEKKLAMMVAALPDKILCQLHSGKNNALITLMFAQALVSGLLGYFMGLETSQASAVTFAAFIAAIPLLLAFGFYRHEYQAFQIYIVLTLVGLSNSLKGFSEDPVPTVIGLAINIAMLIYVVYVKSMLFPEFSFLGLKKNSSGEFQFSN